MLEKIKEKLKTKNKQNLENLYELLLQDINNSRVVAENQKILKSKAEYRSLELENDYEKLQTKYDALKKECKTLKEENAKLHEYLLKNTEILKSINETLVAKKKGIRPSLKELKLEKMTKVSTETKAKLK